MNIKQKVGKRLRELRKKTGMTIEAAAYKGGYDTSYWGAVERGNHNISFNALYDFICTLNSTVPEFFTHEYFRQN